jgi:endopolyphosphatase
MSDCDTPIALVNKTFEWVEEHLKDKIDFVVWTGDSARHDNDEDIPRDAEQVVGSNEFLVQKMFEVFGKRNGDEEDDDPNNDYIVPIIPNLGNNDILPHNVMAKGPNAWTRTFARVWRQFIPEVQKHQFEQGGWFYVEVIPNKLAVFSLNTLYFFSKNAATDGCASPREPGYQQMEWLRIQLQFMRERGMKAILSGHVPPVRQEPKTLWEETCWQKYTLWNRQYRDVIVGSLYGHFNYDHFMLQDFKQLDKDTKRGLMNYYRTSDVEDEADDDVHTSVSTDYWTDLREEWSELPEPPKSYKWPEISEGIAGSDDDNDTPLASWFSRIIASKKSDKKKELKSFLKKIGGPYAERFSNSFVSASVVPNLFPAIRVYEYNTSGLSNFDFHADSIPSPAYVPQNHGEVEETATKKKKDKKYKFTVPDSPSKAAPPGPAYSPQTLSLLGYTQYFVNLTHINNDFTASDEGEQDSDDVDAAKWKEGKHKGKKPHDKDHAPRPKKFKFEVHYDTRNDDVYKLKDLTMPSLVDLARRIGDFVPESEAAVDEVDDVESEKKKDKKKKKKHGKNKKKKSAKLREQNEPWFTFIRRAFIETMEPGEIEEEFGN